ncbi:unnamed protein product [Polarella glacialis]|uniref:K Homology domain-containing protein n=1 Tax=Polarella glacialis TaxID=89957 RepID=A0A813K9S5_POLGL|nr:unnamed protein product [Polarella glacialis]
MKCNNSACPYLHSVEVQMSNDLIDTLPSDVLPFLKRWLREAIDLTGVDLAKGSGHATIIGPRIAAIEASKLMVPCKFKTECTNRECKFLHAKSIPIYDNVIVGRVIGEKGKHVKTIQADSGAFVRLSGASELWVIGSQTSVCQAEKALRSAMFQSAPCHFGMQCTAFGCKFNHPAGHTIHRARQIQAGPCHFGMKCTAIECKFTHPARHSIHVARRKCRNY